MTYYCDEIFSNHAGEDAAVKQTVFFLQSRSCYDPSRTVKCHMHCNSDPPVSVK